MFTSDYSYHLPSGFIASHPTPERTHSRLLCFNKSTGEIAHRCFRDLIDLLEPGDCLVLNDTQVISARLLAHKSTGARVELLLSRVLAQDRFLAHVRSNKPLHPGVQLRLSNGIRLEMRVRLDDQFEFVCLDAGVSISAVLDELGHIPLPPYLRRPDTPLDRDRYQTVFARSPGAVAAPTAGLHFDSGLLQQLQGKGVHIEFVTLHVGYGTFQSIRTEHIVEHRMHAEYAVVSASVCEKINETRRSGRRIVAVGTTTLRALETAALSGMLRPFEGETRLFIYPGFSFNVVDALVTNFHLPKSSLLILVTAFAGYRAIMQAYHLAIAHNYRFFSYGDAMWIGG